MHEGRSPPPQSDPAVHLVASIRVQPPSTNSVGVHLVIPDHHSLVQWAAEGCPEPLSTLVEREVFESGLQPWLLAAPVCLPSPISTDKNAPSFDHAPRTEVCRGQILPLMTDLNLDEESSQLLRLTRYLHRRSVHLLRCDTRRQKNAH